ncbi:aminoacyl-tRNA hydrolase [Alphaproteobacteria bacterium]|nr:aminoacyl-tRNA hydrolase [Alphaproteobacteria bacterium]
MILIVGLGNPGEKYINTRHNIGFKILDSIVEYYDFSLWKKWRNGILSKGSIGENTVLALKPTTFMNLSGVSVNEIVKFYKINIDNIIVIHDELDLKFGSIKSKIGGGSAGHLGIENIAFYLGKDFARLRYGIDRPEHGRASSYVLKNFNDNEILFSNELIKIIIKNFSSLISKEFNYFNSQINLEIKKIKT